MISIADWCAALDRMTETEIADTITTLHQSYTNELEVHA